MRALERRYKATELAELLGMNVKLVIPRTEKSGDPALKACGHVVGYLGDGIDDAPSLHTAYVGIQ